MTSPALVLRNSERGSYKTCRHRWQWTWLDQRQARDAPTALRFGDLIHRALAPYYKPGTRRGPHPAETFAQLYDKEARRLADSGFDVYDDEQWVDARELGVGMLDGYVREYADADQEYEVISSEQTFQWRILGRRPAHLPAAVYPAVIPFLIVGTLDGVWRHRSSGRITFKEYKTASAISEDGLAMDEQPTVYWTYSPKWFQRKGVLKPGEYPNEILYTILRKALPHDDKPRNAAGQVLNKPKKDVLLIALDGLGQVPRPPKTVESLMEQIGPDAYLLGEVSKSQPTACFARIPVYRDDAERERLHERIVAEAFEIWAARNGRVSLFKNPGPLHMPNCRGCPVREACEVHEAGGDFQSVLNSTTVKWDPYAAHELAERK